MLMKHTRPPLFTHNEGEMKTLKMLHKKDMERAQLNVMKEVRVAETSLENEIDRVIKESLDRDKNVMRDSLQEMANEMEEME